MRKLLDFVFCTLLMAFCLVPAVSSQTTIFTYQGSVKDGANAANGNYDFEFALFDVASGGMQLSPTLTRGPVAVADGIFAVQLDFGAQFTGANRFLEIRMRPTGDPGGFQQLLPRQAVSSAPYSVRSLNSTTADNAATANNSLQLGGVAANQFVVTTDPRMTDPRPPTAGSANYIQNQSAGAQASSSFNISGNGTAGGTLSGGVVNAATEYRINGSRILGSPGAGNTFGGIGAGSSLAGGVNNTFFGNLAGQSTTAGLDNSFFGRSAGFSNTTGGANSFFGVLSGGSNTTGGGNSFFGANAGNSNSTGASNSFVGAFAGQSNSTASNNSFFGREAGVFNTTGFNNSFVGAFAGRANTVGLSNSFFGSSAGSSNTTGGGNSLFGVLAGGANTTGTGNSFFGGNAGDSNTLGINNTFVGAFTGTANTTGDNNTLIGRNANVSSGNLNYATAIGADSVAAMNNSIYLGRADGSDTVRVPGNINVTGSTSLNGNLTFASGGIALISSANVFMTALNAGTGTTICRTASNQIVTCSSSLRYKTNIARFGFGLDLIGKLKPITFDWKDGGPRDLGLGAEDVAAIEPLLVTYNDQGQIEGVKYDRIGIVLVNAVKEQQEQIEILQKTNATQQTQIEALQEANIQYRQQLYELKNIVCAIKSGAAICK